MNISSTSLHEAGHACIAYHFGPCPTYVYSNPDKFEGYCQIDMRFKLTDHELAKFYMAGSCCEHLWAMGEEGGPTDRGQISVDDLIEINRLGLSFSVLGQIQKSLYRDLKKAKADIIRVAKFLDEYQTITSAREFRMVLLDDIEWVS